MWADDADMGPATNLAIDWSCIIDVIVNQVEDYGHKGGNAGKGVNLPKTKVGIQSNVVGWAGESPKTASRYGPISSTDKGDVLG